MRLLLLAAAACLLPAQEIMPARPTPGDYKAQATVGGVTLAAEFQGRTVPAPQDPFVLKNYVVVEVALYTGPYDFNAGRFSLRLNGKTPLLPQTAGMVGGALRYSDWEGTRGITANGSYGSAGVVLGRQSSPRFPGDRRAPTPPPGTPNKPEAVPETAPWDWVEKLAWADGPGKGPAAGLLYFPYAGNLAKLDRVELIYNGPEGMATLALRGSAASPAKSGAPARKP